MFIFCETGVFYECLCRCIELEGEHKKLPKKDMVKELTRRQNLIQEASRTQMLWCIFLLPKFLFTALYNYSSWFYSDCEGRPTKKCVINKTKIWRAFADCNQFLLLRRCWLMLDDFLLCFEKQYRVVRFHLNNLLQDRWAICLISHWAIWKDFSIV